MGLWGTVEGTFVGEKCKGNLREWKDIGDVVGRGRYRREHVEGRIRQN